MFNKMWKKYISLILVIIFVLQSIIYAKPKNPYEGEVDMPSAESKVNISEATIISINKYEEYNPINPVKPGVNKEEYDRVDNYQINLKTLESRIKYFSPTYNNIKLGAESSYWMAFYARGGNDTLVYDYKNYTEEIHDVMSLYKDDIKLYVHQRNLLDRTDPDYTRKYNNLTTQIENSEKAYTATKVAYNVANTTIRRTKQMLGLNNALYNIGNVDNNNRVAFARRSVTKALTSVVLTYFQLSNYVSILEKQSNLYYDMYLLNKKNYDLGLATALDVSTSLETYENIKNTFKTTETTLKNVKEQIAINLGYKISDIDKLEFIEPEPDFEYLESINFDADKERAYTSNSSYNAITLNDKDKKYPQSTGENIFHKRQEYMSSVITAEFENIYNNLLAKKISYESSLYLNDICNINDEANKRKFDNNLISELEYKGLELQNLGNKLQVKVAKYDLINAINEYYYATLGEITIS